jgi:hypothetical protein
MRGHGRWNTRLNNFKFTSCLRIGPNALVLTGLANFRVVDRCTRTVHQSNVLCSLELPFEGKQIPRLGTFVDKKNVRVVGAECGAMQKT